jgi:transcriptional regulator with XRE-family HTH domain
MMKLNITPFRRIRLEKGLSQYDLSALSGIVQPRISVLERGIFKPRASEAEKLARALNIDVENLFNFKDEAARPEGRI